MNILESIINQEYTSFRIINPESERVIYFRMLSLREYEKFSYLRRENIVSEWDFFEQVFKYCYLGEYSFLPDNMPAGFTISIGKLIMYISGDCDRETILDDIERVRLENPENTLLEYMRTVIFTVFNYSLEDVESWDRQKFLRIFTIAENVLSKQKEEFKRMDLKELRKSMNKSVSKSQSQKIDFAAENRAILGNTSFTEREQIVNEEASRRIKGR